MSEHTLPRLAAAALVPVFLASCAGASPKRAAPGYGLPAYSGCATALFDDSIEPQAVGYALDPGVPPDRDRALRDRTLLGDGVLRVRVVTVSSKNDASGLSWRLDLHTLERLAGARPPPVDFPLDVRGGTPSAGVMRTFDERLVGMTMIVFLRSFAGGGSGAGELHFHVARADDGEISAVRVASLLGDVR